jgi:hypothetical protein
MWLNVRCVLLSQRSYRTQIQSKVSQCTVHPYSTYTLVKFLRDCFPLENLYILWNFFINNINESADFMIAGMSDAHAHDMRLQGITGVRIGHC